MFKIVWFRKTFIHGILVRTGSSPLIFILSNLNLSEETTEEQATTEISKVVGLKVDAAPGRSPSSNSSGSNAESLSAYLR